MNTQEFLDLLTANNNKNLLFQYAPNQLVGANYHLTEVKNVTIESVDCGANYDTWQETIVQIWESPADFGKTEFITVNKALSILKKVDDLKKMVRTAEIKFEYGNATFHTAHLFVNGYEIKNNNLIINLSTYKTDCKAKELCGVPNESPKKETSCSPDSGCC